MWDQSAVGISGGGSHAPGRPKARHQGAPPAAHPGRVISTPSQARHARISSSRRCRAGRVVSQTFLHLPVLARLGYNGGYHLRAGRHLCPRDAQGFSPHLCPPALSPGFIIRGPTPERELPGGTPRWENPRTPRLPPEGFVIPPTDMRVRESEGWGDGRGGGRAAATPGKRKRHHLRCIQVSRARRSSVTFTPLESWNADASFVGIHPAFCVELRPREIAWDQLICHP